MRRVHLSLFVVLVALVFDQSARVAFARLDNSVTIVYPSDASLSERLAAKEIRRYLYLRTGKVLPMVEGDRKLPPTNGLIIIGRKDRNIVRIILNKDVALKSSVLSLLPQQYQIKTLKNLEHSVVLVAGGDEFGTLYGAYRFVEHFGVRFYLHGDVVPDEKIALKLPDLDEQGKPLFDLRGIHPFHDFPEGPDWWNVDDYKAIIGQLPKLRMNFFGLHCYPESGAGPEPTVWIGLPEDVKPDGEVKLSSASSYANTLRGNWGYSAKNTGEFNFGAAQLFERDDYGPEVMFGQMAWPKTLDQRNEVFGRAGNMLKEAFEFAHALGVKTCVGTETPLVIPGVVKERIKSAGNDASDPAVVQRVYEGMFLRIKRTYPLDYYWLWTPESWTWKDATDEQVAATERDLLLAVAAAKKVNAPFTLATCGWVLGPPRDRAQFDNVLPKEMPFSCINRQVGFEPIEPGFARLVGRAKWAIPWLEDDPALISPQLWVGRMRMDAVDALKYGCTGLMGIHWRTRILGPNISALAKAAWEQGQWSTAPTEVSGRKLRDLPTDDFYADWALTQFGPEAAAPIAKLFQKLDGGPLSEKGQRIAHLPRSSKWDKGPGAIAIDSRPWDEVAESFAFVEDFAKLEKYIKGAGNQERFDYWLNTFRYMKAMGQVGCTLGPLDKVMKQLSEEKNAAQRTKLAQEIALPLRQQLVRQWGQMVTYQLAKVSNTGEMGVIANIEQHSMLNLQLLNKHDKAIQEALGKSLPADMQPGKEYRSPARVIVPTVCSILMADGDLKLKVIILAQNQRNKAFLYWRPMGADQYNEISLTHIARGVYSATIPAAKIKEADLEYHVKVALGDGRDIYFPATAPQMDQTVVIIR